MPQPQPQPWQLAVFVVASVVVGMGVWFALGSSEHGIARDIPNGNPAVIRDQPSRADDGSKERPDRASTACGNASVGEICFSDGSTIRIAWRPQPAFEGAPEAPYAPHYVALANRAHGGDALAAFSLFEMLGQCNRAHQSVSELRDAIELLHQTHQFLTPDMPEPRRIASSEKIPVFESMLRKNFQDCSGLTRTQIDERDIWLKIAAGGESPTAKLLYGASLPDHNTALVYIEAAWTMGEIEALPLMASIFRHQYDVGVEPTFKVKAYATYLAYVRLLEATMGPGTGHGPIAGRQVERVQQGLRDRASELVQYELDEANQIAFELIASNEACCFGL